MERARVTRILSDIKKSQGDLNAAADILCELQVETFGSMTRREKTDFILEQVGLCLERGDYTQAAILSRKINKRYFARKPKKTEELEKERKELEEREKTRAADEPPPEKDEDVTDLKLRYYYQQIQLANHDHNYLEVCKHYRDVLDTESIEQDPEKLPAVGSLGLFEKKGGVADEARSLRGLSTMSCLRHMTTSNTTCCTGSNKTSGCLWCPWRLGC